MSTDRARHHGWMSATIPLDFADDDVDGGDAIKRIADERGVPMSRVVEDAIAALVAQGKP